MTPDLNFVCKPSSPSKDEGSDTDEDNEKPFLGPVQDADAHNELISEEDDEEKSFFSSDKGAFHADSFMDFHLSRPLVRACNALGFEKPTPIQAACIPLAMMGRDICGSAVTGSGKTAAFAIPTLERLLHRPKHAAVRALVLVPTRELALQVLKKIEDLAQYTDIRCCQAVGKLSIKAQEVALRAKPDIVVATPGRLLDHLCNSMSVHLEELQVLILDEADRLLDQAFSADVHKILQLIPKRRQTMLFSATMDTHVSELVKLSLTNPVRLSADPSAKRPARLTEEVVWIRQMHEVNKEAVLLKICSEKVTERVIIFSGTKAAAHRLAILFGLTGLKAAELHGNCSQDHRLHALELFKNKKVDFLITTGAISRGIDIPNVETVINYECPSQIKSYVHQVGRTARAGLGGCAVTFVTDNELSKIKEMAKATGSQLRIRTVAQNPVTEWSQKIEEMEGQVAAILQQEREEEAIMKAEMEAKKAENMLEFRDLIFSRPKRTYPVSEKQKKMVAIAAKASLERKRHFGNEVISAEQTEYLKIKDKKKREHEKNLPRKKRRKLEAARELLEEENQNEKLEGSKEFEKNGMSLVNVAYRRAKAVKAAKKARNNGKTMKGTTGEASGSKTKKFMRKFSKSF